MFITGRVFTTIFEFFCSYIVVILGYAVSFHILLPQGELSLYTVAVGDYINTMKTTFYLSFDCLQAFFRIISNQREAL